ncbi:MAG: hypothetical protein Wins2KO_19010 [Winogradskyella sp.]
MKYPVLSIKNFTVLIVFFITGEMYAQLGFCQGNSGDPIFVEDFGAGIQDISLPAGTTTYTYANGQPPNDGLYTVSSNTNYFDWFNTNDHTPSDNNGRMLIVNSSFSAGEFYRTAISGLCENTTYEFSSWLLNLAPLNGFCGAGAIPVNVRFEIWDNTDTNLLASGNTGNITGTVTPTWDQYALVFQTIPGQTSVILKMINNSSGGCGNDVAIDDIVFKSCGDLITVEDSNNTDNINTCSAVPFSDTLTAIPDNTVFSAHFYQWQISNDGINWSDISGETNASLVIGGITTTTYYRAKVAEYQTNLSNEDCITLSNVYQINVNQAPIQPTVECWEIATFDNSSCSWIVSGSQPTEPTGLECWETAVFNTTTCSWEITGTQPAVPTGLECWETATFDNSSCSWTISGTQPVEPNTECWETAIFNTTTCIWEIAGTQPAAPTGLECWETATFDNSSCSWTISGTQPVEPNTECWETATFNTTTCIWEITGTQPAAPTGLECWETATFDNSSCSWTISGTQPVEPNTECWETAAFNTTTCSWEITGTQPAVPTGLECWETATFDNSSCSWIISGTQPIEPTTECWETATFNTTTCNWEITGTQPIENREEYLSICQDDTLTLEVSSFIESPNYQWQSGETTSTIVVDSSGVYIVEVTDGCFTEVIAFYVELIALPIIQNVISDNSSIIINLLNESNNYFYSINGVDYQSSNFFPNQPAGLYTVFVKSDECEVIVTQEYFHFYIQKFMTPNNDGDYDYFTVNFSSYFSSSEVLIFDRYGKLLFSARNRNVQWDGTFNGQKLPTSDYWYNIVLDGKEYKGHFTLKR